MRQFLQSDWPVDCFTADITPSRPGNGVGDRAPSAKAGARGVVSLKQGPKRDQRQRDSSDRRARPRGGRRLVDMTNEEREERAKLLAAYAARQDKPNRRRR
jgi:hypothetical protein